MVYQFMCFLSLCTLDHFIPALLPFVVMGLVSLVPRQEIGWKNAPKLTYSVSSGT